MLNSKKYSQFFTFLVLFICLFIFILFQNLNSSVDKIYSSAKEKENFQLKKRDFKECMKEAANIYYNDTDEFFGELSVCIKRYIAIGNSQMDFFENHLANEKKVYLPMAEEYRQNECKWLTIGIGGSIAAEELFSSKYPNCLIYGVDPTTVGNFSKIGSVLPFGVDLENNKTSQSMSFIRMLDEFVQSRFIHYLSIDIEGLEMVLVGELVGFGKYVNENITFCQIDIEMHSPSQDGIHSLATKINRVQWMLDFLVESSPYIPIYTTLYPPAHKVTFINVENQECEKAFKFSSYFVKK